MINEKLESVCYLKAEHMIINGMVKDMDVFQLTDLLISIEIEKIEKQQIEDCKIDYDDEIVEISEVGELETVDISVTGNQLFYCNDILTKNSMGITHTADAIFALITSEDLENMGQLMFKQLKNRWGDINVNRRFLIGIDKPRMKLRNLDASVQKTVMNENNSHTENTSQDNNYNNIHKIKKNKLFDVGDF
jgi:hypothetical protein